MPHGASGKVKMISPQRHEGHKEEIGEEKNLSRLRLILFLFAFFFVFLVSLW
jgi:hypothetical protein